MNNIYIYIYISTIWSEEIEIIDVFVGDTKKCLPVKQHLHRIIINSNPIEFNYKKRKKQPRVI